MSDPRTLATKRMAKKPPLSIEIAEEGDERFVVSTYADGEVVREAIDPKKNPLRRRHRPYAKAKVDRMDHTKKKLF